MMYHHSKGEGEEIEIEETCVHEQANKRLMVIIIAIHQSIIRYTIYLVIKSRASLLRNCVSFIIESR